MTTTAAAPSLPEVQVNPERIMQFAWGYAITLVMEAAIRHRVFDVLDNGPMNIDGLQQATGASRRGLAAIVNVLVGLNFVSKDLPTRKLLPHSRKLRLPHLHQAQLHGGHHPPHQ
jgi:hypothetical protein